MFFRGLINSFPVWELFFIIVLILTLISLLASYLGSLLIPSEKVDQDYSRSTDSVLSIMGSGYGVFLGFVIITLWNHYLNVQKVVYEEADALSAIVRHLEVLPSEDSAPLKKTLQEYIVALREDEWPKMREGVDSVRTTNALHNMSITYQNFNPKNKKEDLFYREMISHLDTLLKSRRDRLIAAQSILSAPLRMALILGAVMIIFLASLLKSREGPMRMFANFCLAIVIGFNLTLALSFDFPFSGSISVSKSPYYHGVLTKY